MTPKKRDLRGKGVQNSLGFVFGSASMLLLGQLVSTTKRKVLVGAGLFAVGVHTYLYTKSQMGLFFSGGAVFGTIAGVLAESKRLNKLEHGVDIPLIYSPLSIKQMLREAGYSIPKEPMGLKLVLDIYDLNEAPTHTRYFWNNIESDNSLGDWVPASVIKVFAVLAALQKLTLLGFGDKAVIEFKDTNQKISIKELVWETLVKSNNMTYNRLVQLVGHDNLHDGFLRVFPNTEINTPYMNDQWALYTQGNTTFAAPRIEIQEGGRSVLLDEKGVRVADLCRGQSACTRLSEMNDVLAQSILFDRYSIAPELRELYLSALGARKSSGENFSEAVLSQITNYKLLNFNKHGYTGTSYNQSVLLYDPQKKIAFVVSASAREGSKSSLDLIGRVLGRLLNNFS
jgi:hypothetical protein